MLALFGIKKRGQRNNKRTQSNERIYKNNKKQHEQTKATRGGGVTDRLQQTISFFSLIQLALKLQ